MEEKIISKIAEYLHIKYEIYAKGYNWKTQKKTKVDFKDIPEENKLVMLRIAKDIYHLITLSYVNGKEDCSEEKNTEIMLRELGV